MKHLLILSLNLVLASPVLLAEEAASRTAAAPGANDLAGVAVGLLLVLGLIFALAWLFRRYGNLPSFNRSNIQILGGVSLGPREKAVLLEVEGQRLLVGVAAGQVSNLLELPPRSEEELAAEQAGQVSQPGDNLSTVFSRILKGERQSAATTAQDKSS